MGKYQNKQVPMSQIRDMKDKVADHCIYEDKEKQKRVGDQKVETIEEFIKRGGKIQVLKSKKKYSRKKKKVEKDPSHTAPQRTRPIQKKT